VSNTFTFTDVTKGFSHSETELKGGGNANHNQTTTTCKATVFEGEAGQVFGVELPPNVEASDTVRGEFEVQVVLKR
jgi:hypothetical protein